MEYTDRELKRSLMKIESLLVDIYDELDIKKKVCPICESEVRIFTPFGEKLRPNAKCPVCGSLERTRAWWLYYTKIGLLNGNESKIRMLHFAPERPLWTSFDADINIDYFPVDFNPDYYGIRDVVDITDIPYEDEQFDIIICNHVFEHIVEEQKALQECYRVLKRDGTMYISVPFSNNPTTLEKAEYNTETLKSKYYGKKDHVRLYGMDVRERLEKVFHVEEVDCIKELELEECSIKKYGLSNRETLWKLSK